MTRFKLNTLEDITVNGMIFDEASINLVSEKVIHANKHTTPRGDKKKVSIPMGQIDGSDLPFPAEHPSSAKQYTDEDEDLSNDKSLLKRSPS